jgi:hypothetical protein
MHATSDDEYIVRVQANEKLGITFRWDNGLTVSKLEEGVVTKASLGDRVVRVNGSDLLDRPCEEVLQRIQELEYEERVIAFRRSRDIVRAKGLPMLRVRKHRAAVPPLAEREAELSLLSQLRDILKQRENVQTENRRETDILHGPVYAHMHNAIQFALARAPALQAMHVDVQNDSYWYKQRRALGARNMMMVNVALANNMKWESRIYKMKHRKQDVVLAPELVYLASHASKCKAYKLCEAEIKARDCNPAELGASTATLAPENVLATHFRIMVVSDKFHRLSCHARNQMVYRALLDTIGTAPDLVGDLASRAPSQMKGFSWIKGRVTELDFLKRFASDSPLHITIEARTPSQWKPQVRTITCDFSQ